MTELSGIAQQSAGMGKSADWDRAVVGGHATKFAAGDKCGARAEVGSAKRSNHASRSGANNKHVSHLINPIRDKSSKQWPASRVRRDARLFVR